MELPVEQQLLESFSKANKILIVLPKTANLDKTSAGLALRAVLRKMGKQADLISAGPTPETLDFISESLDIGNSVGPQDILVVTLNTQEAPLDELSYQAEDNSVKIFLKPKGGKFSPNDISVDVGGSAYNLVVTIGAQTLEDLGELYQHNAQLFFDTPKVNIDTNPGNEYFGTINIVDVTASAVSELVTQLLVNMEPAAIDEHVATALLAGIIAQTHSFQDVSTTPKTLTIAADLVARGARQQDIIKSLYKTKDFAVLKLWGRALARIKTLPETSLLYSVLTKADFQKTGLDIEALPSVLIELVENVSGFQTVVLLGEHDAGVRAVIAGLPHVDLAKLGSTIGVINASPVPASGLYHYITVEAAGQNLDQMDSLLASIAQK